MGFTSIFFILIVSCDYSVKMFVFFKLYSILNFFSLFSQIFRFFKHFLNVTMFFSIFFILVVFPDIFSMYNNFFRFLLKFNVFFRSFYHSNVFAFIYLNSVFLTIVSNFQFYLKPFFFLDFKILFFIFSTGF